MLSNSSRLPPIGIPENQADTPCSLRQIDAGIKLNWLIRADPAQWQCQEFFGRGGLEGNLRAPRKAARPAA
jgi:hypothetical protein